MNIYSSHIIQIFYDICHIIIKKQIDDYLKNYVDGDFIHYTLKSGLNGNYLKDVNDVYDMINQELKKEPIKELK
jgi:hypothetical protein